MRSLNAAEIKAVQKLQLQGRSKFMNNVDRLRVQYLSRSGGFTICVVRDVEHPEWYYIGVSRRSSKDKPNHIKGNMLALIRAMTNLATNIAY